MWMLKEEDHLRGILENLFKCPFCGMLMVPPSPIYQCDDGHILCAECRHSAKLSKAGLQECPSCDRALAGRNVAMERIATLVFPPGVQSGVHGGDQDGAQGGDQGGAQGGAQGGDQDGAQPTAPASAE